MADGLLSPHQKELLDAFSQKDGLPSSFFLTGGTALSYFYFHHRFSEDLDFFSEKEFEPNRVLDSAVRASKKTGATKVEQQSLHAQEIFYYSYTDGSIVKIYFACFPFPHFGEFKKINLLKVSSLEDLAINKLQAIVSRKRSRDFVDLYFCAEKLGWGPKDLQRNYQLKFDVHLSPEQLAASFASVVDSSDLPRFLGTVNWKEIENFFLGWSKQLKEEIIK